MRLLAIINPIAGAYKHPALLRAAFRGLESRGIGVRAQTTGGPGDARRMAREAGGEADMVLVVGGDGTVCEAADGLSGTGVPLVIWPAGTENLVARSLRFRAGPEPLLECVTRGRVLGLDLGVVNGQSFLVVVGVGFDAEVVHRLTCGRKGHISHLSYTWPLWRTFWEHRFPEVRVEAEDSPAWTGQGMVFIGNMARYALGLPVVRDARPDDGLLDLLILPCRGKVELIGHSLRTLRRTHIEHAGVIYRRTRHIRVESRQPMHVEMDGDLCGQLPIEVSVRPSALSVQVPPQYNPSP